MLNINLWKKKTLYWGHVVKIFVDTTQIMMWSIYEIINIWTAVVDESEKRSLP